jgi:hypothetical protein
MGSELSFFADDLTKTIGKLKELETTSHSNSKIGLKTIQDAIKKLVALEEDLTRQMETLQGHFSQENNED